jgi:hypothetical protein
MDGLGGRRYTSRMDHPDEVLPHEVYPVSPPDFVTTWRQVVQDPVGFFASMPESGGLGDPLRFLAICAAIDAVGTLVVSWGSVVTAIAVFLGLVVGSFLVAAALTLVTQHLFEGRAGFEPVFRVVAYASAPAVAFWVPWLAAIPCLYAWYLQVRGIERVQSLDALRATVATTIAWVAVWLVVRGLAGYPIGWLGTR